MSRFSVPRKLRLAILWVGVFTLVLALRYEMEYRDGVRNLPQVVDAQGKTASVEVAMSGLDSYTRAKQMRRYGLYSLLGGMVLCVGVAVTKQSDERGHVG